MPAALGLFATDTEAAAARWARRKLGTAGHERRVLAVASKLFDLTRSSLHLAEPDHELLRLAALVHDIGRCVSEKDHPARGAMMIEQTTALELSAAQRRRLAFLTRYHRGAVPPAHRELHLGPTDPRRNLRAVLALLRAADALDHRRQPATRLVLSMVDRRLSVRCVIDGDVPNARRVYTRRKKYRLLESFLGHPVRVGVEAAA
ncbi:MAG TPA: HD domain-containing protein [Tepidisphaeraceae bacterium]|jgi:exopolyphosphatase/guanosine-5'-triphosphate,3'-diphosphate pyrophosphatase